MKLIPVIIATLLIVAAIAATYLFYSSNGGNAGTPEGISLHVGTTGSNYRVYVGLRDSAGHFVSSAGSLNFTVRDSRGQRLFSYARQLIGADFKQYRIDQSSTSLRYSFNFSEAELKPGVPFQNGSGVAQASFTPPNGSALRQSTASLAIRALPKISIGSVNISKVGSVGAYVTIAWSPSNFTAYSGDLIAENVSLFFFNVGDEGIPLLNVLGIDCLFSVNTTGFQLVAVFHPDTKINASPVFLVSNARIAISLVLKTPGFAYSGPLIMQVSMEPAS